MRLRWQCVADGDFIMNYRQALRDVPAGKPFKIVQASELPDAPQEAWVVDDADLNDGVGGESNEFD